MAAEPGERLQVVAAYTNQCDQTVWFPYVALTHFHGVYLTGRTHFEGKA